MSPLLQSTSKDKNQTAKILAKKKKSCKTRSFQFWHQRQLQKTKQNQNNHKSTRKGKVPTYRLKSGMAIPNPRTTISNRIHPHITHNYINKTHPNIINAPNLPHYPSNKHQIEGRVQNRLPQQPQHQDQQSRKSQPMRTKSIPAASA